jgi:hypothetical protein
LDDLSSSLINSNPVNISLPTALLQGFNLVVGIPSSLDVADTVLFIHDTLACMIVIVTHGLVTFVAVVETFRKFVTSNEKIEQEPLRQVHNLRTTTLKFLIPQLKDQLVQQEVVQLAVTRDKKNDPCNLAQRDAFNRPVRGKHCDRVIGKISDAAFVGEDVELEQILFKYSRDIVERQCFLAQLTLIQPDEIGLKNGRLFIV